MTGRVALERDALMIDLFMAGCVEWMTDPVGVNPRPNLTSDLDDWGMETLTRRLGWARRPKLGFDPDAYLPTSCVTLPEGNRDKRAQLGMMGLRSESKYDRLRLAGDEPKVRRCYVIDDLERFANFAKLIRDASPSPTPRPNRRRTS